MFNTYRDPTGCYGDLNVESYPQNADNSDKMGPSNGPSLTGWNMHVQGSTPPSTPHGVHPSPFHSAFHHHPGATSMEAYSYSLSQVPIKETEPLANKDLIRSSPAPPPTSSNNVAWQNSRPRSRYPTTVSGGAFLPYQTQYNHFDGSPLESGSLAHGHGRKQSWPGESHFQSMSSQQFQRDPSIMYGDNHRGNVTSSIIRHTASVTSLEARNSQPQPLQAVPQHLHQQQPPLLHHPQQHPVPHHEIYSQLVPKDRDVHRMPAYPNSVRHSVVRSRIPSYTEALFTQHPHPQYCSTQDMLRKASMPMAMDADRPSAFTARQSTPYNHNNWNKSAVPFLPFPSSQMLAPHRGAGSAFQPCTKAGETDVYSPESLLWAKPSQIDHGRHVQSANSSNSHSLHTVHHGQPSWMHDAQSQMYLTRQIGKPGLVGESSGVLTFDAPQLEAHSSVQPSVGRPSGIGPNVVKASVSGAYQQAHQHLQSHNPHLRPQIMHQPQAAAIRPLQQQSQHHQQSIMSQHQASPLSNPQHSPVVASPHSSIQSPQLSMPCPQQQQTDPHMLCNNEAENLRKENSSTGRSLRNCLDVRQFLATWDEDTDVGTPRPCYEEGESGEGVEQPADSTEEEALVVLDCRSLQKEEAANLITMYSGADGLLTCSGEGMFAGSSETVAQGVLQNLIDNACGASAATNTTTITTPTISPTVPNSTRSLENLLNSALPTPPPSEEPNLVQTKVSTVGLNSPNSSQVVELSREPKIDVSGFGLLSPSSPSISLKYPNTVFHNSCTSDSSQESIIMASSSTKEAGLGTTQLFQYERRTTSVISGSVSETGRCLPDHSALVFEKQVKTISPRECGVTSPIDLHVDSSMLHTESKKASPLRKRKMLSPDQDSETFDSFDSQSQDSPDKRLKSLRTCPVEGVETASDRSKWAFSEINDGSQNQSDAFKPVCSSGILKVSHNWEISDFVQDVPYFKRRSSNTNDNVMLMKSPEVEVEHKKYDKRTSPNNFSILKDSQTEENSQNLSFIFNNAFSPNPAHCLQSDIENCSIVEDLVLEKRRPFSQADVRTQTEVPTLQSKIVTEPSFALQSHGLDNTSQETSSSAIGREVMDLCSTLVENIENRERSVFIKECSDNGHQTPESQALKLVPEIDNNGPDKSQTLEDSVERNVCKPPICTMRDVPTSVDKETDIFEGNTANDMSIISNQSPSLKAESPKMISENLNVSPVRGEELTHSRKKNRAGGMEIGNQHIDCEVSPKYLSRIVDSSPGNIPKILLSRLRERSSQKNGVIKRLPSIRLTRISSPMSASGSEPEYVCSVSDSEAGTPTRVYANANFDSEVFDAARNRDTGSPKSRVKVSEDLDHSPFPPDTSLHECCSSKPRDGVCNESIPVKKISDHSHQSETSPRNSFSFANLISSNSQVIDDFNESDPNGRMRVDYTKASKREESLEDSSNEEISKDLPSTSPKLQKKSVGLSGTEVCDSHFSKPVEELLDDLLDCSTEENLAQEPLDLVHRKEDINFYDTPETLDFKSIPQASTNAKIQEKNNEEFDSILNLTAGRSCLSPLEPLGIQSVAIGEEGKVNSIQSSKSVDEIPERGDLHLPSKCSSSISSEAELKVLSLSNVRDNNERCFSKTNTNEDINLETNETASERTVEDLDGTASNQTFSPVHQNHTDLPETSGSIQNLSNSDRNNFEEELLQNLNPLECIENSFEVLERTKQSNACEADVEGDVMEKTNLSKSSGNNIEEVLSQTKSPKSNEDMKESKDSVEELEDVRLDCSPQSFEPEEDNLLSDVNLLAEDIKNTSEMDAASTPCKLNEKIPQRFSQSSSDIFNSEICEVSGNLLQDIKTSNTPSPCFSHSLKDLPESPPPESRKNLLELSPNTSKHTTIEICEQDDENVTASNYEEDKLCSSSEGRFNSLPLKLKTSESISELCEENIETAQDDAPNTVVGSALQVPECCLDHSPSTSETPALHFNDNQKYLEEAEPLIKSSAKTENHLEVKDGKTSETQQDFEGGVSAESKENSLMDTLEAIITLDQPPAAEGIVLNHSEENSTAVLPTPPKHAAMTLPDLTSHSTDSVCDSPESPPISTDDIDRDQTGILISSKQDASSTEGTVSTQSEPIFKKEKDLELEDPPISLPQKNSVTSPVEDSFKNSDLSIINEKELCKEHPKQCSEDALKPLEVCLPHECEKNSTIELLIDSPARSPSVTPVISLVSNYNSDSNHMEVKGSKEGTQGTKNLNSSKENLQLVLTSHGNQNVWNSRENSNLPLLNDVGGDDEILTLSDEERLFPNPINPNFDVTQIPLPEECIARKNRIDKARNRRNILEQKSQSGNNAKFSKLYDVNEKVSTPSARWLSQPSETRKFLGFRGNGSQTHKIKIKLRPRNEAAWFSSSHSNQTLMDVVKESERWTDMKKTTEFKRNQSYSSWSPITHPGHYKRSKGELETSKSSADHKKRQGRREICAPVSSSSLSQSVKKGYIFSSTKREGDLGFSDQRFQEKKQAVSLPAESASGEGLVVEKACDFAHHVLPSLEMIPLPPVDPVCSLKPSSSVSSHKCCDVVKNSDIKSCMDGTTLGTVPKDVPLFVSEELVTKECSSLKTCDKNSGSLIVNPCSLEDEINIGPQPAHENSCENSRLDVPISEESTGNYLDSGMTNENNQKENHDQATTALEFEVQEGKNSPFPAKLTTQETKSKDCSEEAPNNLFDLCTSNQSDFELKTSVKDDSTEASETVGGNLQNYINELPETKDPSPCPIPKEPDRCDGDFLLLKTEISLDLSTSEEEKADIPAEKISFDFEGVKTTPCLVKENHDVSCLGVDNRPLCQRDIDCSDSNISLCKTENCGNFPCITETANLSAPKEDNSSRREPSLFEIPGEDLGSRKDETIQQKTENNLRNKQAVNSTCCISQRNILFSDFHLALKNTIFKSKLEGNIESVEDSPHLPSENVLDNKTDGNQYFPCDFAEENLGKDSNLPAVSSNPSTNLDKSNSCLQDTNKCLSGDRNEFDLPENGKKEPSVPRQDSSEDDLPPLDAPGLEISNVLGDFDSDREMPCLQPEANVGELKQPSSLSCSPEQDTNFKSDTNDFLDMNCHEVQSEVECIANEELGTVFEEETHDDVALELQDDGFSEPNDTTLASKKEISSLQPSPPDDGAAETRLRDRKDGEFAAVVHQEAILPDDLYALGEVVPVPVDSVHNWPYVEEVCSTPCDDDEWSHALAAEEDPEGRPQLRCSLSWDRILPEGTEGEGLVLGPAKVEVRLAEPSPAAESAAVAPSPASRPSRSVVDRRGSAESVASSCHEENNNLMPGVIVVNKLILKRPDSSDSLDVGAPLKTKGALKSYQTEADRRRARRAHRARRWGAVKRSSSSSSFDSRQWYSQISSPTSPGNPVTPPAAAADVEVPIRVIIKRESAAPGAYKSVLPNLLPVVLLERDPVLDAMALALPRRRKRSRSVRERQLREDRPPKRRKKSLSDTSDAGGASIAGMANLAGILHVQELVRRWRQEAEGAHDAVPLPPTAPIARSDLDEAELASLMEEVDDEDEEAKDVVEAVAEEDWSDLAAASSPLSAVTEEAAAVALEEEEECPASYQCEACGEQLLGDASRANHIKQHPYRCQRCYMAFPSQNDFTQHLQTVHPNTQQLHHCLLCLMTFPNEQLHAEHIKGRQHCHMERSQRRTIHTLFRMFTGSDCPRVNPLSDEDLEALDWLPNDSGAIHFYHQATPLQLATEDWQFQQVNACNQSVEEDTSLPE